MNREILFKAKRTDNGEWVEGYYVKYQPCASRPEYVHGIVPTYASALYMIKIDPDTLCQYTGLTDKNGKKIWENDIVSEERTFTLADIKWFDDDYAGWHLYDNIIGEQQTTYGSWGECEVIGNIFDNPELMIEE